ncbi:Gfo/Idh/MocA family oxidoreductase [Luteimonas sp. SMYT11W]|uniref:Gfo/Idh/MocA family oxidoreductase n=1 Tax=Luteimonas flava TaxID=3115822 RepID=A0ABU7WGI1_9GAMM
MAAMGDIRWGMIGVGSVAEHKSGPAFARAHGGRLAGVASRRAHAAHAYAERHGVALVFPDATALIESPDIDAVYIATPPASHVALTLSVARAGKPCCVEKPMSVRHADALRMQAAFVEVDQPLFVAYYRRTLPRFEQVDQWIRDGAIGEIESVAWQLHRTPSPARIDDVWRLDPLQAPGGLFEDLACHGLDLFDMLLGPITCIDRATLTASNGRVPDHVAARWRHGERIVGEGDWNFAAGKRLDRVTITGTGGAIRLSMFDDAPLMLSGSAVEECRLIEHPVPIQLHHVQAMNQHLRGGAPHPSTVDSAIRTAWATEQILRGPGTEAVGFAFADGP